MSTKKTKFPDSDEGHTDRLKLSAKWCKKVLSSSLAQDTRAPELGTKFHLTFEKDQKTGESTVVSMRRETVDRAQLDQAATLARIFTLRRDGIHGTEVARSIARYASTEHQKFMASQLEEMWEAQPFTRTYMMKTVGGRSVTPPGGVPDGAIADKVLYSELLHADDASEVLEHVSDEDQEWSLMGLVGDWFALISHQEALICSVRPDLCPSPTVWAGDQVTIFRRLGVRDTSGEPGEEEADRDEVANPETPGARDDTSNHENEDQSETQD